MARRAKAKALSPLERMVWDACSVALKEEASPWRRRRTSLTRSVGSAASGVGGWWKKLWSEMSGRLVMVATFLRDKPFTSLVTVVAFVGVCIAGLTTDSSTMSAIRVADAVIMLIESLQGK